MGVPVQLLWGISTSQQWEIMHTCHLRNCDCSIANITAANKQVICFINVAAFYALDCSLVTSLHSLLYRAIDKEIPSFKVECHIYTLKIISHLFWHINSRTCCKMFISVQSEILGFHHCVVEAFTLLGWCIAYVITCLPSCQGWTVQEECQATLGYVPL